MRILFVLLLLAGPAWARDYTEEWEEQGRADQLSSEHQRIENRLDDLNERLIQREQERRDLQYELRQRCIRLHYPYIAECGYY